MKKKLVFSSEPTQCGQHLAQPSVDKFGKVCYNGKCILLMLKHE